VRNDAVDPTLLIFSAQSTPMFRTVKLRHKRKLCVTCGSGGENAMKVIEETNYDVFCGQGSHKPFHLDTGDRMTPVALSTRLSETRGLATVIDVRPSLEFGICHLPGSINVPISIVGEHAPELVKKHQEIYVVCRTGSDSQKAVLELLNAARTAQRANTVVKDIVGGLVGWHLEVDKSFPVY